MDEDLDWRTIIQLKQLLRDFGLRVTGSKPELIARLWEKYSSLYEEIENGSNDVEQFDDQFEKLMDDAHEYQQEGMQNEDSEYNGTT